MPSLRVQDWTPTRETLDRHFEIEFNVCTHTLTIDIDGGDRRTVPLEPKSVASSYAETMAALRELGIEVAICTTPVELPEVTPFEDDQEHTSYDAEAAQLFWRQLSHADRVLTPFRSRFIGKVSPVHVFWGGLDLACTRFSGRDAPRHPGGAPNVGDWVMGGGVLARAEQLRVLAGRRRRGHVLRVRLPRAGGIRHVPGRAGRGVLLRRRGPVRSSLPVRPGGRRPGRRAAPR